MDVAEPFLSGTSQLNVKCDHSEGGLFLHSSRVHLRRAFNESASLIFLACLIFPLAGSAFAKNNKDKGENDNGNGGKSANSKSGQIYAAPEFNFSGLLKYELLVLAGGGLLLLKRRRRRRRVSLDK